MITHETNIINLLPEETKCIFFKKAKFSKKPVVNASSINGNNDFFISNVNNRCFTITNNTEKNIKINYVASENTQNNIDNQSQGKEYFVTAIPYTEEYSIAANPFNMFFELQLFPQVNYTEDEELLFSIESSSEGSSVSIVEVDNQPTIFVNPPYDFENFSLQKGLVTIRIRAELVYDSSFFDIIEFNINIVD